MAERVEDGWRGIDGSQDSKIQGYEDSSTLADAGLTPSVNADDAFEEDLRPTKHRELLDVRVRARHNLFLKLGFLLRPSPLSRSCKVALYTVLTFYLYK